MESSALAKIDAFGGFAYFLGKDRRRQAVGVEQWVLEERIGRHVRRRRRFPDESRARAALASWCNLRRATAEAAL